MSGARGAGALVLGLAGALAGCGGGTPAATVTQAEPVAQTLARQAPPPSAAGLLSTLADGPAARTRVGYVNAPALAALLPAGEARAITRAVLGSAAGPQTTARVGAVTVLRAADGARTLRGPAGALRDALADASPERSVIQPTSPGAVQSCLGDAAAETLVGAQALGPATTLGVGLTASQDAPAGLKLLVCLSPAYRKQLYGGIRRMEARFGRPDADDPRAPVVGEDEIGEQQIARAIVPVERLAPGELAAHLAGGARLRSLLPAPPR